VTAVGDEEVRALDRGDSTEVAMNEIHTWHSFSLMMNRKINFSNFSEVYFGESCWDMNMNAFTVARCIHLFSNKEYLPWINVKPNSMEFVVDNTNRVGMETTVVS
jgi:hypothetical protein